VTVPYFRKFVAILFICHSHLSPWTVTYKQLVLTSLRFCTNFNHVKLFREIITAFIVKSNGLMHYLPSVYFVNQPLHVSGIFVAHHHEVYHIYTQTHTHTTIGTCCAQHVPIVAYIYIHSIPPDDGLQIYPKHVEVDWRNEPRINSASSCISLHGSIYMHGQQNIKVGHLFGQ
jgi:hypothetical protein